MEIRRIFPLISGLAVFVCICWAFSALYTSPFNTKSVQAFEADARVDAVSTTSRQHVPVLIAIK